MIHYNELQLIAFALNEISLLCINTHLNLLITAVTRQRTTYT